jgi:CBS domain-containing protein
MRLSEIMNMKVEVIDPAASLDQAQSLMRQRRIHHLVVMDGKRVIGMLTEQALQRAVADGADRVEEGMFRDVATATPETTLKKAANLMRGGAVGALPVLDRQQRLAGIVTVADLLDLIGRGAERPVAKGKRWTLKDRGTKPRSTLAAARSAK